VTVVDPLDEPIVTQHQHPAVESDEQHRRHHDDEGRHGEAEDDFHKVW
jgi:hypothetical protein